MNLKEAKKITGGLSSPSKMPGYAYNLPAWRCITGVKLQAVPGSVCAGCYAMKGRYRFRNVKEALDRRLTSLTDPRWVQAMAHLINSKKPNVFRWHDSGDVQDLNHLNKIYEVCRLTPSKRHWLPTREAWIKDHVSRAPDNLVIRFSMPMIDQPASGSWTHTSTVVTSGATCPSAQQDNECKDCRNCWNKEIKNISYGQH